MWQGEEVLIRVNVELDKERPNLTWQAGNEEDYSHV